MKRYILLVAIICLILSGCAVDDPKTMGSIGLDDPMATWDPFVGGFEYSPSRIFLQVVDGGEKPVYNIAYRHKDETVEILEPDVSSYSSWKLVGQRLYFVSGETLYAMDIPGGEHSIFEIDRQKYVGVLNILDIAGDQLLCGAEKWEKNTDPMYVGDYQPVDTKIMVKLDFTDYFEVPA